MRPKTACTWFKKQPNDNLITIVCALVYYSYVATYVAIAWGKLYPLSHSFTLLGSTLLKPQAIFIWYITHFDKTVKSSQKKEYYTLVN